MKNTYIFGEGGLGREIFSDFTNNTQFKKNYSLKGFVVDHYEFKNKHTKHVSKIPINSSIIIAIGDPIIRKKVYDNLHKLGFSDFPSYISSSIEINSFISFGTGNIFLKGTVFSVNIKLGDFNVINKLCSIGHDVTISNFCTLSPNVSISGGCNIHDLCFFGITSTILPNVNISEKSIIGAGTLILKDTITNSTYVGVPAKRIK
jgi:sugar O-acyltransferase (sialic acid O-acetyltransferase NeuD family)